jgi:hypothetical protein
MSLSLLLYTSFLFILHLLLNLVFSTSFPPCFSYYSSSSYPSCHISITVSLHMSSIYSSSSYLLSCRFCCFLLISFFIYIHYKFFAYSLSFSFCLLASFFLIVYSLILILITVLLFFLYVSLPLALFTPHLEL